MQLAIKPALSQQPVLVSQSCSSGNSNAAQRKSLDKNDEAEKLEAARVLVLAEKHHTQNGREYARHASDDKIASGLQSSGSQSRGYGAYA